VLFRYLIDNAGRFKLFLELTKVTRECLGDDEEAVAASFIIVQRVDPSKKVELSVWCVLSRDGSVSVV